MRSIKTELKPKQATVLTMALREALSILEMPTLDLAEWLQEQIEHNPALQFDEKQPSHKGSFWTELEAHQIAAPPPTLYYHLLQQARECLSDTQEIEILIGNLDDKGFLDDPSANPALVQLLQTFDPPGVGAKNLRHSLLLQLERKKEQTSLAYRLIQDQYDDFIHNRTTCSPQELASAIDTLSSLSLDPAAPFRAQTFIPQTPDIFIESQETDWVITLNDTLLPRFTIDMSPELYRFHPSAQWIEKMVSRRSQIMIAVVKIVLEVQSDFFFCKTSDLHPLSFKQVAAKLSLHESTLSRAVKDKVLSCPRGIYPLRFFFPHTSSDSISHHTAKERLKVLIEREDKHRPLSDQALTSALHSQGIPCARRTVTKYRQSLQIPAAYLRRSTF